MYKLVMVEPEITNKAKKLNHKFACLMTAGGKCNGCSEKVTLRNTAMFLFHHVNPSEKSFNMAGAYRRNMSNIFSEMAKCEVMCFNCHQKLHAEYSETDYIQAEKIQFPWDVQKCKSLIAAMK